MLQNKIFDSVNVLFSKLEKVISKYDFNHFYYNKK